MLRFAPEQANPVPSRTEKLRRRVLQLVGWSKPAKAATAFPVQELDVWVPDHALWSLRLFTCVSVLFTVQGEKTRPESDACSPKPATDCTRHQSPSCTTCSRLRISCPCSSVASSLWRKYVLHGVVTNPPLSTAADHERKTLTPLCFPAKTDVRRRLPLLDARVGPRGPPSRSDARVQRQVCPPARVCAQTGRVRLDQRGRDGFG